MRRSYISAWLWFLIGSIILANSSLATTLPPNNGSTVSKMFCIEKGSVSPGNFTFVLEIDTGKATSQTVQVLVKEGDTPEDIIQTLKDQAKKQGVTIKFGKKNKCDSNCFLITRVVGKGKDLTVSVKPQGKKKTVVGTDPVSLNPDGGSPTIKDPPISELFTSTSNFCSVDGPTCTDCLELLARLSSVKLVVKQNQPYFEWITLTEKNNEGFRVWRGIEDSSGNYTNITTLTELSSYQADCTEGELTIASPKSTQLILPAGNERQGACYSFVDKTITQEGTYYYVLEDIDNEGESIFHCENLVAATIGQGLAIDLESAIHFCKEITGST